MPQHTAWLTRYAKNIDKLLADGDLLLVIAGDDINADLLRFARHFAAHANAASLNELALIAMALYRRGNETLLIPHVVSAVERQHRRLAIRVVVETTDRAELSARIATDQEDDAELAVRAPLPSDPNVRAFLQRAKSVLDPVFDHRYETTKQPRKSLSY